MRERTKLLTCSVESVAFRNLEVSLVLYYLTTCHLLTVRDMNFTLLQTTHAPKRRSSFLFTLLSTMSVLNIFRCNKVHLSFMHVGHTNFFPDSWSGILKAKLSGMEINCVLDIDQVVIEFCYRELSGFMGWPNRPQVPKFTHDPFENKLLCYSFNLNELRSKYIRSLVGQSQLFDIMFNQDGLFHWIDAPLGNLNS